MRGARAFVLAFNNFCVTELVDIVKNNMLTAHTLRLFALFETCVAFFCFFFWLRFTIWLLLEDVYKKNKALFQHIDSIPHEAPTTGKNVFSINSFTSRQSLLDKYHTYHLNRILQVRV